MRHLTIALLLLLPWTASTAQIVPAVPTRAEIDLFERLLKAEDARAATGPELDVLVEGTRSASPWIRATAVRALGRLERPAVVSHIAPLLSDADPEVRRVAAVAAAQAASRGGSAEARAALLARVGVERDPFVRGMLGESMGRMGPFAAPAMDETSGLLARLLDPQAPAAQLRGAVRGTLFFLRGAGNRLPFPPALKEALTALTDYGVGMPGSGGDTARYIRMVAAAALFSREAEPRTVARVAEDPSELVREKAAAALGSLADTTAARELTMRMMQDSSAVVRFRAVGVYGRRFRAGGCAPLRAGALDGNGSVALAALDALAQCRDSETDALLDSIAGTIHREAPAAWHRPAHALVSLSTGGGPAARRHLGGFEQHPDFFVREYAARAARRLADTAALRRLAADSHPNVIATAIDGLSAVVGHAADDVYLDALRSNDSHQLMAAARALQGSTDRTAPAALAAALERVTRLGRETSRDGRVALVQRLRELGGAGQVGQLRPLLSDFDSVVATRVAETLEAWTGARPPISPRVQASLPLPTFAELGELARSRVRIELADGGVIEVGLFPLDAPTNAARFARLARAGYFDGLTLHRVVPAFVVQGGSPGANEYASDAQFTRDELGRENSRGAVGLSTRGRDTGDGQMYVNLIDNVTLDHNYTVFGEIVSGMEVADRLQEGATMRRVLVLPPR